jgi:SOCE-associated regulatory factor of calcium homoeostasis
MWWLRCAAVGIYAVAVVESVALTFNKNKTICLNCTPGFDMIAEAIHCNNDTSATGDWVCDDMPYMRNISVVSLDDEWSVACDRHACVNDNAVAEKRRLMYYFGAAPTVKMTDVTILILHATKYATSRRQVSKPQIVNLGADSKTMSHITCIKEGITDTGVLLWICNDLQSPRRLGGYQITSFRVRCEAYDAHTILAGSCHLEYTANKYTIKYLMMDALYCLTWGFLFGGILVVTWYTETGSILLLHTSAPMFTTNTRTARQYHID